MVESGDPGRNPAVSDEEIIKLFAESSDPVLVASEVAAQLPIGRRAVYNRLRDLEKQGLLYSKNVGGRATVWWHPDHTNTSYEC